MVLLEYKKNLILLLVQIQGTFTKISRVDEFSDDERNPDSYQTEERIAIYMGSI